VLSEEILQQASTFLLEHAALELDAVIQARVLENREEGNGPAPGRVGDAPHDTRDARQDDGARAHGAGFLRHVQDRPGQAPVLERGGRLGDRQDLRVRGRVLQQFHLVVRLRDQLSLANDHGADGHFLEVRRGARLPQRQAHETLVGRGRRAVVDLGRHGLSFR